MGCLTCFCSNVFKSSLITFSSSVSLPTRTIIDRDKQMASKQGMYLAIFIQVLIRLQKITLNCSGEDDVDGDGDEGQEKSSR